MRKEKGWNKGLNVTCKAQRKEEVTFLKGLCKQHPEDKGKWDPCPGSPGSRFQMEGLPEKCSFPFQVREGADRKYPPCLVTWPPKGLL